MMLPQLPVLAFIAAFLVLLVLPSQLRRGSLATVSLMSWLFIVDLILAINSLIWAGNVDSVIPVWCDITTKIVLGANYALPLATICICSHLAFVGSPLDIQKCSPMRRAVFQGVMCILIPVVFMALHVVVQGHRFDIVEDLGCQAAIYLSVPSILFICFPPLLFYIVTLLFAGISGYQFLRQRLTFARHLHERSNMTPNHYIILIGLCVTFALWGSIHHVFQLTNAVYVGLLPYTSWKDVHSDFNFIGQIPTDSISSDQRSALFIMWSLFPTTSVMTFLFFMFGDNTWLEYKSTYRVITMKFSKVPPKQAILTPFKLFDKQEAIISSPRLRTLQLPSMFRSQSSPSFCNSDTTLQPNSSPAAIPSPTWDDQSRFSVFARDFILKLSSGRTDSVQGPSTSAAATTTTTTTMPRDACFPSRSHTPSSSSSSNFTGVFTEPPSPQPTYLSLPDSWTTFPSSNASTRTHSKNNSSVSFTASRLTVESSRPYSGRIYISDAYYPETSVRRTPSPPPFRSHTIIPYPERGVDGIERPVSPPMGYHRPFSPPLSYPVTQPHPDSKGIITVEVSRNEV